MPDSLDLISFLRSHQIKFSFQNFRLVRFPTTREFCVLLHVITRSMRSQSTRGSARSASTLKTLRSIYCVSHPAWPNTFSFIHAKYRVKLYGWKATPHTLLKLSANKLGKFKIWNLYLLVKVKTKINIVWKAIRIALQICRFPSLSKWISLWYSWFDNNGNL